MSSVTSSRVCAFKRFFFQARVVDLTEPSLQMSTALYELFVQRKFHELDMSMRRYKELEKALVNDMKFVHTLQIKDQMLRALPNSIAGLPLSSLSLIYTKFRHFPVVLTQIPTLRELNMGFNLIKVRCFVPCALPA
jgi:hypothetical protein